MLLKRSFKKGGVSAKHKAQDEAAVKKVDETSVSKLTCVCPSCDKAFVNSSSLNRHVREKHGDAADQVFLCTKCPKPKAFTNKRAFLEHQSAIHDGKGHQCAKCKAYFLSKDKLTNHEPSCQGPAKANKHVAAQAAAPVKRSRKSDAMSEIGSRMTQSEGAPEGGELDDFPMITDEELFALPPSCCDFDLFDEEDASMATAAMSTSQTPETLVLTESGEDLALLGRGSANDGSFLLPTFVLEFARLVIGSANLTRQCEAFWSEMGGLSSLRNADQESIRRTLTTFTDFAWRDPRCQIVLWRLGADDYLAQAWCSWRHVLSAELEDAVNALVQRSLLASLRFVLVLLQRAGASASAGVGSSSSSSAASEGFLPADIPGNAVRHLVQWVRTNALSHGAITEVQYLRNNIVQWVLTNTVTDGFTAYFDADQYFAAVKSEQSTLVESLYVLLVDSCLRIDDFDHQSSSRHNTDPKETLELLFRCATITAAHASDFDERAMRFHVWYAEQVARLFPSSQQQPSSQQPQQLLNKSAGISSSSNNKASGGDVMMSLASEMNCNSTVSQNSLFQLVPKLLARRISTSSTPLVRGLTGINTEDLKGGAMLVQNLVDNTRYDQAQDLSDLLLDSSTGRGMAADLEGHLAVLLMKGETGRMRRYMQKMRLGKPTIGNFDECKQIYQTGLGHLVKGKDQVSSVEGDLLEAFYNLSLARLYMEEDQFGSVGEHLERAIALRAKHLQSDHPLTVQAKYNYGVLAERRATFLLDTVESSSSSMKANHNKTGVLLAQVEADLDTALAEFNEHEGVWLQANKVAWVATLRESRAEALDSWARLEIVLASLSRGEEEAVSHRRKALVKVEEAMRNLQMCIETRFRVFGAEHERYQRAVTYYYELKGRRDQLIVSLPSCLPLNRLV